jgi:hypothetical protein
LILFLIRVYIKIKKLKKVSVAHKAARVEGEVRGSLHKEMPLSQF